MVAIKDMEMPKNCVECEFCHYDEDYGRYDCVLTFESWSKEENPYKTQKHPNCPLVEIITCKDCKNHDNDGFCDIDGRSHRNSSYCSMSERRVYGSND